MNRGKRQNTDWSLRIPSKILLDESYFLSQPLCKYCGRTRHFDLPGAMKFETDHIIPVARGGSDDRENLSSICYTCNREKHEGDPDIYEMIWIERHLERVSHYLKRTGQDELAKKVSLCRRPKRWFHPMPEEMIDNPLADEMLISDEELDSLGIERIE